MRPIRSIATALLVAGVAVAGCTRSQPDQRDTATGQPAAVTAPSTMAAPTTPPATKAPATKAPAPSTSGAVTRSKPVVLADGRHPVSIKTVDPDRRRITFDLIQFYWGEEAVREATKDHMEAGQANDYYIRNVNPRLRTLPVRSDATITVNTLASGYTGDATKNVGVQLYRLQILLEQRGYDAVFWITVRHDQVVKIAEQYLP